MKTRTLKELLLYNYRYWFGYAVLLGFVAYFLSWRLSGLPGGISEPELIAAARHTSLTEILNLPLYPLHAVLQFLSFELFGISAATIRIPGIAIGLAVVFLLYHLLRKWFGKPTALLAATIFVSADWFLFVARLGTGGIEFSLWLCLALISFMKLIEKKTKWLALFAAAICGLLFAPFGVYAALTLAVSLCACRIFRERGLQAQLWVKILSGVLVVVSLVTIGYVTSTNTAFIKNLLAIQDLPNIAAFVKNMITNASSTVAVLPNSNPQVSPTGVFFVRFFELIFILFGVLMFWKTKVNRLNLVVLVMSVVLVLAGGLSSGSRGAGLLLVPSAIFMTAGIRHFIHRWQRTFPKNPYARVAAYAPMAVLFISTAALHYMIYFQLWPTQTTTRQTFSPDLLLVQQELNRSEYQNKTCFLESDNSALNTLIIASATVCTPEFSVSAKQASLLTRPGSSLSSEHSLKRALVTETSSDATRWLVLSNQPTN
jgi:hypothetical protein